MGLLPLQSLWPSEVAQHLAVEMVGRVGLEPTTKGL